MQKNLDTGELPTERPWPAPIQPNLTIGQPDNQYEREAERVADQVTRTPAADSEIAPISRMATPDVAASDHSVAGKDVDRTAGHGVPGVVHDDLRSRGDPLDSETRAAMEPRFGHDFSQVRVHTDQDAAESARALGAQAFTVRDQIMFGAGRYDPQTIRGRSLIAHELTHVLQQSSVSDGAPLAQRRPTEVPAPFLGSSPFNDSSITFDPRAEIWINGVTTSSSDFPTGSDATLHLEAGQSGIARVQLQVKIFEDNIVGNARATQDVWADWSISSSRDGTLTIAPIGVTMNPLQGNWTRAAVQSVGQSNTTDTLIVNPTVQGPSESGGISVGVGVESSSPASMVRQPFRLKIEVTNVQPPDGTVEMGPVSVLRNHDVLFERPGQAKVSESQEAELIQWYEDLNEHTKELIRTGAATISLAGHASTTGGARRNRELSNERMEEVQRILQQYAGNRVVFDARAVGEYQAETEDDVESPDERRVVASVWETIDEGE